MVESDMKNCCAVGWMKFFNRMTNWYVEC